MLLNDCPDIAKPMHENTFCYYCELNGMYTDVIHVKDEGFLCEKGHITKLATMKTAEK